MLVVRRPPASWNISSLRRLKTNNSNTLPKPTRPLSTNSQRPHITQLEQRFPHAPQTQTRNLQTQTRSRGGIPSIGSNGQIQPSAYVTSVESIVARLEKEFPNGRAVHNPKSKAKPTPCPALPLVNEMTSEMSVASTKGRCSLVDPEAAREFVRGALGVGIGKKRKEGRVVIEAFPGPGGVTRALLELPRSEVKRVIVLEEELKFLNILKELEYYDDRVHVFSSSGFVWETYDIIKEQGLLDDVAVEDWKTAPHSTLSFIGHLPLGPVGEQLIAQLFRAIPERSWLYKYGRMRMSWLLAKRMVERIQSPPLTTPRCKLTLVAEATSELSPALPDEMLEDYDAVFFPPSEKFVGGKKKTPLPRRIGQPFVSLNVDPLAEGLILSREEATTQAQGLVETPASKPSTRKKTKQVVTEPVYSGHRVTLEKWDYVLRQLFILKSTPLEKAIQNLGAGASILLSKLTGPDVPEDRRVDIKSPINALTRQELARVVEEFDKWPFAPDVLFIADQTEEERN